MPAETDVRQINAQLNKLKLIGLSINLVDEKELYAEIDSINPELDVIIVPNGIRILGQSEKYMTTMRGNLKIKRVSLPESLLVIGVSVFSDLPMLSEVVIPNSVEKIDKFAFSDCINLRKITLGNSIKEIGKGAFYECKIEEELNFPNSLEALGREAFYNNNITKISFDGCKNNLFLGNRCFGSCKNLEEVKGLTNGIDINKVFYGCKRLKLDLRG